MAVDSPPTNRPPRLNPFLFPSDTDFRFALLIVSVLGASLFTYDWLYFDFFAAEYQRIFTQCVEAAATAYPVDETLADTNFELYVNQRTAYVQAREECLEPFEQVEVAWRLGGVTVLLIVAGAIYWTAPRLKIRRDKLVRLNARDAPEAVVYLSSLCREAGLPHRPVFLWNPLDPAISGLAFGRLGQYYVALGGGLVTQFYTDRPAFRAIVLHELAHLRNSDVDKAYFAVAVWQGFVLAALAPFTVSLVYYLFGSGNVGLVFNLAWRSLALAMLVYLIRNAVLRAREVYADVRASAWDGPSDALERVLTALPHPKGSRRWPALRAWRAHPHPDERRQALSETHRLFRMGFWDAFGTGVAATIAFSSLSYLLILLLASQQEILAANGSALLFVPLAIGVVGTGAWRSAFAALARSESLPGIGRLGLGLGLGLVLGQFLSFETALTPTLEATGPAGGIVPVFSNALLVAALFGFIHWIAISASAWLEVATTLRSLRLISALGLIIAGGVLAVWMASFFTLQDLVQNLSQLFVYDPFAIIFAVITPQALLTLASLWAFPLAAWFWRGRKAASSEPNWAFLDSSPQPLALPQQPPLRPGLALIIGLAGGFAFCGLLLVARIVLRLSLSETARSTDEFALTFYYGQIAVAVLIQAGAAAIVAGWVKRAGTAHGLFAAFAAGCVSAVGVLGLNVLFGGTLDGQFVWLTSAQIINWGALLSLPLALGASAVAGWARRLRLNKQ